MNKYSPIRPVKCKTCDKILLTKAANSLHLKSCPGPTEPLDRSLFDVYKTGNEVYDEFLKQLDIIVHYSNHAILTSSLQSAQRARVELSKLVDRELTDESLNKRVHVKGLVTRVRAALRSLNEK